MTGAQVVSYFGCVLIGIILTNLWRVVYGRERPEGCDCLDPVAAKKWLARVADVPEKLPDGYWIEESKRDAGRNPDGSWRPHGERWFVLRARVGSQFKEWWLGPSNLKLSILQERARVTAWEFLKAEELRRAKLEALDEMRSR